MPHGYDVLIQIRGLHVTADVAAIEASPGSILQPYDGARLFAWRSLTEVLLKHGVNMDEALRTMPGRP